MLHLREVPEPCRKKDAQQKQEKECTTADEKEKNGDEPKESPAETSKEEESATLVEKPQFIVSLSVWRRSTLLLIDIGL